MKQLQQEILDALHDATNLQTRVVDAEYFDELIDEILEEQCAMHDVVAMLAKLENELESDDKLITEACQDVVNIANINNEQEAIKLIKEQFLVISRLDLKGN